MTLVLVGGARVIAPSLATDSTEQRHATLDAPLAFIVQPPQKPRPHAPRKARLPSCSS